MPASLKHLSGPKRNIKSILAKWTDGKYYRCDAIETNQEKKKCLVKFEDETKSWMNTADLHMELAIDNVDNDDDIICCICDDGTSKEPNEIIMCDACQQGYHVACHQPNIDRNRVKLEDDLDEWICSTCLEIIGHAQVKQKQKRASSKTTQETPKKNPTNSDKVAPKSKSAIVGKKRPSTPIARPCAAKIKLEKKSPMLTDLANNSSTNENDPDVVIIPANSSIADVPESEKLPSELSESQTPQVAAHETFKIKKTERRKNIEEEDDEEEEAPVIITTSKSAAPQDGKKIERMEPLLIEAAQALARSEDNLSDTRTFANVINGITTNEESKSNKPKGSKLPKAVNRRKYNADRAANPTAAAF